MFPGFHPCDRLVSKSNKVILAIQGAADATNKIKQAEFAKTVAFLSRSVEQRFSAARDDEVFLDEAILHQFRQNQI